MTVVNDRHARCIHRAMRLASVLLPLLAFSACESALRLTKSDASFPTLATRPTQAPAPYVLQPGDVIAVKFYRVPELNEEVTIRPDGMISLQLVNEVQAAGLTPAALDAELTRRYATELASPEVSVIVKTPVSARVYVGGEVGKQGVLQLIGGLTLFQAIQDAGGFAKTAHRKQVILIRKGPDGVPIGRSIDVRPIQTGVHPEEDIPLRPYDVVFVPRSKIANVDVFVQMYIRDALPMSYFPIPAF
jgi:protein involved in polysaccharide export with SLBB domain